MTLVALLVAIMPGSMKNHLQCFQFLSNKVATLILKIEFIFGVTYRVHHMSWYRNSKGCGKEMVKAPFEEISSKTILQVRNCHR